MKRTAFILTVVFSILISRWLHASPGECDIPFLGQFLCGSGSDLRGRSDPCDPTDPDQDCDGDGNKNGQDNCPAFPSQDQTDSDSDGQGDLCDDDDDNDSLPDGVDLCPRPAVPGGGSQGPTTNEGCPTTQCIAEVDGQRWTIERAWLDRSTGTELDSDHDGVNFNCDDYELYPAPRCTLFMDPNEPDENGVYHASFETNVPAVSTTVGDVPVQDYVGFWRVTEEMAQCGQDTTREQDFLDPAGFPSARPPRPLGPGIAEIGLPIFDNSGWIGAGYDSSWHRLRDSNGVDLTSGSIPPISLPSLPPRPHCLTFISLSTESYVCRKSVKLDDDLDHDGVLFPSDNCPLVANPGQEDQDGDDVGDVCDPDRDGDGVANGPDNCDSINNNQQDTDGDQEGNACDTDDDNDGVVDNADNCPLDRNLDQANHDNDFPRRGDACDSDDDDDGFPDGSDNCPFVSNPEQGTELGGDLDGDGLGDACDGDVDGDGVSNAADNCLEFQNSDQTDTDGDRTGNECDYDNDNDGDLDPFDNCPLVANAGQEDRDDNGIGNACEGDEDGDGTLNDSDLCPGVIGIPTLGGCLSDSHCLHQVSLIPTPRSNQDNDGDLIDAACDANDIPPAPTVVTVTVTETVTEIVTETRDVIVTVNGDEDQDHIANDSDLCPNTDTNRDPIINTDGCPDRDRDSIQDDDDGCPDEPGPINTADPSRNGCPVNLNPPIDIILPPPGGSTTGGTTGGTSGGDTGGTTGGATGETTGGASPSEDENPPGSTVRRSIQGGGLGCALLPDTAPTHSAGVTSLAAVFLAGLFLLFLGRFFVTTQVSPEGTEDRRPSAGPARGYLSSYRFFKVAHLTVFFFLLIPFSAQALSVEQFRPCFDGLGLFNLLEHRTLEQNAWSLGLHTDFAKNPIEIGDAATRARIDSLVDSQLGLTLTGAYGILPWFSAGFTVPFFPLVQVKPLGASSVTTTQALGDVGLAAKLSIIEFGNEEATLESGLGVSPFVTFPTGDSQKFSGHTNITGGLLGLYDIRLDRIRMVANAGVRFREKESILNLTVGHEALFGLGVSMPLWEPADLHGLIEVNGSTTLSGSGDRKSLTPVELSGGLRKGFLSGRLRTTLGSSVGLNNGYGTPDYRVFSMVSYVHSHPKPERPPETLPLPIEVPASLAKVDGTRIVTLQPIFFETGRSIILQESLPVVQAVADLLIRHPSIQKIVIEGHTDNRGSSTINKRLSHNRAKAVMEQLITDGISPNRLTAKGLGPSRPIASNNTEEGRIKNRRVEFHVQ